jgi:opacity protein-like surface antigen
MKHMKAVLAVAGIAAAVSAQAAEPAPADLHFYLGGTVGRTRSVDSCNLVSPCSTRDIGRRLFAGYQLTRRWSVEAGYHQLGEVKGPNNSSVESKAIEGLALYALPLSERFALYGKLGAYRGSQQGSGVFAGPKVQNSGVTYGWGVQYDAFRNVSFRAEWQDYPRMGGGPTLPKGDVNVFSLGVLFRAR